MRVERELNSGLTVISTGLDRRKRISRIWRRLALLWESPVSSAILAFACYSLLALAHGSLWRPSPFPYFNYLADAFMHGQLNLRILPTNVLDLSYFNGQYYLYWSPLPAVLMLPFVALFGVQFGDVIFTAVIAAGNVSLIAVLLRQARRRGLIRLSRQKRGILVLFFALGTVQVTLAPFGRVWFTAQIVSFFCVGLAYVTAIRFRSYAAFVLTGLAIAGALLTRNHVLFAGVWPAFFLLKEHRSDGWRRNLTYASVGLMPILVAVGLLGVYNWLRFDNMFDNGIAHHMMASAFVADYQRYGPFNIHYVPINLFYQYIAYPLPLRATTHYGGSLFLLSPLFFGAFWSFHNHRGWSPWMMACTVALISIPILLLMGTGWVQFGPRYTLDFTVPLLLLTAMGVRDWSISTISRLTLLSIIQYSIGVLILIRSL